MGFLMESAWLEHMKKMAVWQLGMVRLQVMDLGKK